MADAKQTHTAKNLLLVSEQTKINEISYFR